MSTSVNGMPSSLDGGDSSKAPGGWLARVMGWLKAVQGGRGRVAKTGSRKRRGPVPSTVTDSGFAHTTMVDPGTSVLGAPATVPGQRQLWKDAAQALDEVLSRHAASRRVFRHLGVLEKAIAKHGPRAPRQLPIELLEQALAQLETLVSDWSSPGLAFLRSSISVEVKERLKVREAKEQTLSVFVAPNKLQVDEDSESAFMEFQRHWAAANASAEATASSPRPRRAAA